MHVCVCASELSGQSPGDEASYGQAGDEDEDEAVALRAHRRHSLHGRHRQLREAVDLWRDSSDHVPQRKVKHLCFEMNMTLWNLIGRY